MGLFDWRIVVAIAALALVVAAVGLRGRQVDALPRCKRRRCRYDLNAFIGEARPGAGYPVTCPECGRTAGGEREVKWGKRKARRWLVWLSAVVLALCAAIGGVEVYARATNANTLRWMPLWLILDRAATDTMANRFVHQHELLRRADAGEISGGAAPRVVKRILEWQNDEAVHWVSLGDVFASLAMKGYATEEELRQFWANVWTLSVHTRETAVEDEWVAVEIHGQWKGHKKNSLTLAGKSPVALPTAAFAPYPMDHFSLLGSVNIEQNGAHYRTIDLTSMYNASDLTWTYNAPTRRRATSAESVYVWVPGYRPLPIGMERTFIARKSGTSAGVDVRCRVSIVSEFEFSGSHMGRPKPSEANTRELLEDRGFVTSWAVDATRTIEIVEEDEAQIPLVSSPGMLKHLQASMVAEYLEVRKGTGILTLHSGAGANPKQRRGAAEALDLPMAHRIFLRLPDGTEVRTESSVVANAGAWSVSGSDLLVRTELQALFLDDSAFPTIVLRPDPVAARSVTGIDEIWDGVLEIPVTKVTFNRPQPAAASTTTPEPPLMPEQPTHR